MTTIKITLSSLPKAKILVSFLRTLGYVKDISIEDDREPLTAEDWIRPGRPATEAEIDSLIEEMEKDDDPGMTTEQLEKEIAQWNKGIYK